MSTDLDTLRVRLQQEEEHLEWFTKSGQKMSDQGVDTTERYVKGVKDRIANIKKQIASHKDSNAQGA